MDGFLFISSLHLSTAAGVIVIGALVSISFRVDLIALIPVDISDLLIINIIYNLTENDDPSSINLVKKLS